MEIIDTEENIENFLDVITTHIPAGLVTVEKANIKFYKYEKK